MQHKVDGMSNSGKGSLKASVEVNTLQVFWLSLHFMAALRVVDLFAAEQTGRRHDISPLMDLILGFSTTYHHTVSG